MDYSELENDSNITIRVPKELKNQFNEYCTTQGLKISEAIRNHLINDLEYLTSIEQAQKEVKRIKLRIEEDTKRLKELETFILKQTETENENRQNKILISEKMEAIRQININENGITENRIKAIANNEINPKDLILKAKQENINIIQETQITTDKKGNIINMSNHEETTKPDNTENSIKNIAKRKYRKEKEKYNNDKKKFLKSHTEIKKMCYKHGIDYKKIKNDFLKCEA